MILMVSYDLKNHERPAAYQAVREMIAEHSISAMRPLYSQWFVETDDSIDVWHERMRSVTDEDDNWFIQRVSRSRQGWLSKSVWEWLRSRET